MPVELTERALRHAVATLAEHDDDGAQAAESALDWMGWQREGPLLLRRYDVQLFAWYTLPRKFLAPLEDKREAAAAVARLLERLGGRAATYADVCRSPETDDLLRAWESDDPAVWRTFRNLLDGSGLEPPDTDLLAWGQVMGPVEAGVREQVSIALEEAIEDGRLTLGAAGFRRRQAQVADAALREPCDWVDVMTRLEAVQAERLERWLDPRSRRGPERCVIVGSVAAMIGAGARRIDPESARAAVGPALWLLDRAQDAIALTQTGALSRAFVRAMVEQWPEWWYADASGPPNREDDVALLHELHALLRAGRLIRRKARTVVITARGRELRDDPAKLLAALAGQLLAGESFRAACAELAGALIVGGAEAHDIDGLAGRIHPAIAEQGWRSPDGPVSRSHVAWMTADVVRAAEALGLLARAPGVAPRWRGSLVLTEAGRFGLIAGLRARALAPARTRH